MTATLQIFAMRLMVNLPDPSENRDPDANNGCECHGRRSHGRLSHAEPAQLAANKRGHDQQHEQLSGLTLQ